MFFGVHSIKVFFRLFVVLDEEINIFKFPNPIAHESRIGTAFNPRGKYVTYVRMYYSYKTMYT